MEPKPLIIPSPDLLSDEDFKRSQYSATKIYPLFSWPVMICGESYKLTKKEIKYIENLKRKPNIHNQQSANQDILNTAPLKSLKKFIQQRINQYAFEFLKIKKDTIKIFPTLSWANYNATGESHHKHHHGNSYISGVLHIQGPTSPIKFYRPGHPACSLVFDHSEHDIMNSETYWIEMSPGQLFLFPSLLPHGVDPNPSTTPRITISFNTFISGSLGTPASTNNLKINENSSYK